MIVDEHKTKGYLAFTDAEVVFYPAFRNADEVHLPYESIERLVMHEEIEEHSRITFTRLFFLKLYALALPKHRRNVQSSLTFAAADRTVSFVIKHMTTDDIWQRIAPIMDPHSIPIER